MEICADKEYIAKAKVNLLVLYEVLNWTVTKILLLRRRVTNLKKYVAHLD